jgi:hypothetical protein
MQIVKQQRRPNFPTHRFKADLPGLPGSLEPCLVDCVWKIGPCYYLNIFPEKEKVFSLTLSLLKQ